MTEQTSSEAMDRWRLAWREHPVWGELQTTANVMDEAEDDQPYGGHEDVKTRARWIQLRTLLAEALNFREEPQVRVTDLTLDDLAKAATAIRSHLPEGIDTIWSRPQNQPNKPAPITNLLRPYRAFAPTGAESFDVSMAGLREQQSDFLRKLQARVEVVVNDTNAMSQQLAGRIESYESTWEKQQARFDAQAEAALEDLKSHEVRGKKIVATVAHEATAGHYEVAATKSETTATRLRGGAIGMAAVHHQLAAEGMPQARIAAGVGMSRSAVGRVIRKELKSLPPTDQGPVEDDLLDHAVESSDAQPFEGPMPSSR